MSVDPYYAVKTEVDSTLQTAETLRASYLRIRSTASAGSEELEWARNELKGTLAALEADLEDLEESVRIVESTGSRLFGLEARDVADRKNHLGHVRRAIETIRAEVSGNDVKSTRISSQDDSHSTQPQNGEDVWSKEEQQVLMQQQDNTLTSISGTLHTLAEQAGLMGQEILEHNEMLHDLEGNVDRTEGKLNSALKKMQKFIRDTEETKSGWCIGILIVILCILLLMVVLL